MPRWTVVPFAVLALATTANAVAQEGSDATAQAESGQYPEVSGSVGFGFTSSSGNTDSSATRARADTTLDYVRWRHRFDLSWFRNEEDNETTADRRKGSAQSDLRISERSYLFANANAEDDRFGAFERRYTATLGVGRRMYETPTMELDLEVGAGQRWERAQGADDTEDESIARGYGAYRWQFSPNSRLIQEVTVESGSDNTYSESETQIQSRLTEDLSWTLSYVIQRNSQVPEGRDKTDTFTAITLDYGF